MIYAQRSGEIRKWPEILQKRTSIGKPLTMLRFLTGFDGRTGELGYVNWEGDREGHCHILGLLEHCTDQKDRKVIGKSLVSRHGVGKWSDAYKIVSK